MSGPNIKRRIKKGGYSPNAFNSPLTGATINDVKGDGSKVWSGLKYNPDEVLSLAIKGRLVEKAEAIINEGLFIGIVTCETRPHYLKLASFSEVGYQEVKEILRHRKRDLVKMYDRLLAANLLQTLEVDRYEMLYKAKYNTEPISTVKKR